MNGFIKYLQNKDLTTSTQSGYLKNVTCFLQWYSQDIESCTKKDIIKYLEHLKRHTKQQNQSRSKSLIALKHYFEYLKTTGQTAINPTALIKIRGTKKHTLYNIYTPEELQQLADDYYHNYIRDFDNSYIPLSTRYRPVLGNQRNYLMLSFLVYQGLHTNELQKITLDDIDLIKATVKIQGTRRTNERTITLRVEQIGVLMHYTQNVRPQFLEHYKEETEQLFLLLPEHKGSREISTNYNNLFLTLRYQIKRINPGFENFKQLRASVITHWLKTAGLRKTQYFAGHRYISSTEQYLPNNIEALKDDITKYNPF